MKELIANKLVRTLAILGHALLNYVLISLMYRFDITGSWMMFSLFLLLCLALVVLFIVHIISFYKYLQNH